MTEEYNPTTLIDFAGFKVFESATVDVNILNIKKCPPSGSTQACSISKGDFDIEKLSVFVQQQSVECHFAGSDSWVILSPIEQSIKRKIEAVGTPLKDWDINIYRGFLPDITMRLSSTLKKETKSCLTAKQKTNVQERLNLFDQIKAFCVFCLT